MSNLTKQQKLKGTINTIIKKPPFGSFVKTNFFIAYFFPHICTQIISDIDDGIQMENKCFLLLVKYSEVLREDASCAFSIKKQK